MERLLVHLEQLLRFLSDQSHVPLKWIAYLSSSEEHELLEEFNSTSSLYPSDQTMVSLFEAQVNLRPDAIALVYEE